ncbi:two component transcriptional regulator, LytTR family [Dyadobacter koreensis]|uniref:Two component transcriptional regulator, LytTR family n=1 Tax=Dyadobacter koreensis TaxID=408657 RepID=A0A1H6YJ63_9BACT|nr:LytTR family DNA-binding domain-containing protein [Dyadobacter koreensis]SEJ41319.1 two component transcriptional regulator, LytTR family [Dyadobacter koreensis]
MIKAIAIDDERPALEILGTFCGRTDFIDLQKTFIKTGQAREYLEENPVDLIFLDIHMPVVSGIDFFKNIPHPAMVIFTTAYAEYAVESYELNAVDYLLKPFSQDRFLLAANKALQMFQGARQKSGADSPVLYFRVDYGLVPISINDILFIEGLDNYLKIHLISQKPVVVRLTMKAMMEKLPEHGFVRIHRSYIVSLDKVASFRNKHIQIGQEEIPVGASYEEYFKSIFR